MKNRLIPSLCAALVGLAFGCGEESDGGNEPVEMTAEDKLVMALGGPDVVDDLQGVMVEATGSRYLTYEGRTPDEVVMANNFTRSVSVDLANDFFRVDTDREVLFLFTGEESYTDIVRGNVGTTTQQFFGNALELISADKVAAIRMQETLLNPHVAYARFSQMGLEDTGLVDLDGASHHRMVVTGTSPEIRLFVHAETGELTMLETMELDFFTRDALLEVHYDGWQMNAAGAGYPSTVSLMSNRQEVIRQQVQAFEVNPAFPEGSFDFPAASMPVEDPALFSRGVMASQWYFQLDSIGLPFTGIDTAVTPVEVAAGVEQLQGGSHHSFLVEQAEGLVLVDAPLYGERTDALLAEIESLHPGKPITHVVSSHFHEDHAAGIRQVLGATNASLVVHESVAGFWRNILGAPSTLAPDALAISGREVPIVSVPNDGSLTLEDAEHPVSFYDMNSTHADDLLLTHDETSNTVFVVDIYSPGNGQPFGAEELDRTIVDNELETETLQIVGGHGTAVDDYATLQGWL